MEEAEIAPESSPDIILTIASFFFSPPWSIFVCLPRASQEVTLWVAPPDGEFSKLELKESALQVHLLTFLQPRLAESLCSY